MDFDRGAEIDGPLHQKESVDGYCNAGREICGSFRCKYPFK